MEEQALHEMQRLKELLIEFGISEKKVMMLDPVIENTAWMKVKLDEAREVVQESSVVISYDNGGGQTGIRENPIFKGYEALWKSYMSGMNIILNALPKEVVEKEADKVIEARTMLEIVRDKHKRKA